MAQRETSALRLKSSHPVVWDARRIQIAQLVSSLGKEHTTVNVSLLSAPDLI